MKTEPKPPAPPNLLGGVLTLTIGFGLFGGLAWLAGVPRLYLLASVAGGLSLSIALMVYAVRRAPSRSGSAPEVPGSLINPFSGRFGAAAFWFVGVLVIPSFAAVVSSMGVYVAAPLIAALLAPWLPPERTAAVVGWAFYLASLFFGVLFWRWSWHELKPRLGAA